MKKDFEDSSSTMPARLIDAEWEERVRDIAQAQERYADLDLGQIAVLTAQAYKESKRLGATDEDAKIAALAVMDSIHTQRDLTRIALDQFARKSTALVDVTADMARVASQAYWDAKNAGKSEEQIAVAMKQAHQNNFDAEGKYIGPASKPAVNAWGVIKGWFTLKP